MKQLIATMRTVTLGRLHRHTLGKQEVGHPATNCS